MTPTETADTSLAVFQALRDQAEALRARPYGWGEDAEGLPLREDARLFLCYTLAFVDWSGMPVPEVDLLPDGTLEIIFIEPDSQRVLALHIPCACVVVAYQDDHCVENPRADVDVRRYEMRVNAAAPMPVARLKTDLRPHFDWLKYGVRV